MDVVGLSYKITPDLSFSTSVIDLGKINWRNNLLPNQWMITHNSWWDSVDSTNSFVISKYFLQFPEAIEPVTSKWNQSSNKWLQRMSLLFQLLYKDKTDTILLSKYIEYTQLEEDFFIRKAIGWALRAYAYTDPKWVKNFVKIHPQLSNLSKKEALKHQ